ncbi:hypothetical protein MKX01_027924 [Papaver californicum]|nr:hypothetical protein MKX01_027924 [Papaver californicum]
MEETMKEQPIIKTMKKQLTGKRDDTPLHSAVRCGNLDEIKEILSKTEGGELKELLCKQNQSGETALYVAAEYGDVALVEQMIKYYDFNSAGLKARNGYDAFHIAAKQGDLEIMKVLWKAHPTLSMTVDASNTTALHTAASQGHLSVVNFLLEVDGSLAKIMKNNKKTALHSAARNGHLEVLKSLVSEEPGIVTLNDKKGQTALHMAVKGQKNIGIVEELIKANPSLINMVDGKGNTSLHVATRKGRAQIVKMLLEQEETDKKAVNRVGETARDTAEIIGNTEISGILQEYGVIRAKDIINPPQKSAARELKQTVSDIKHDVHYQLEHTKKTRKRVQGIRKQINKMHTEGLNNAINSTTVVAVLIATVAFAAIFQIPGQFEDDPDNLPKGHYTGQARIASKAPFLVFFIFDSFALFISLAVVVVQTSVVVIEREAKKKMMAIINKLMWLACILISIAFLALAFIVVGKKERWLAIGVTVIGSIIMVTTLGIMCYLVMRHRREASNRRSMRRSSLGSRSLSWSFSASDEDVNEMKTIYAI